jgi:hypothetical protein
MVSKLRKGFSRLTSFFDFRLPSFSFDTNLFRDRQIFVSISSKAPDAEHWIDVFKTQLGERWNLVSQNDFRPWTEDIDPNCWWEQFPVTRTSYAMLVVTEPEEGTSEGQDVEIEDAIGRGIPVAYCRTCNLGSAAQNQAFKTQLLAHQQPQSGSWSCFEYFDFLERDVKQELARLDAWLDRFAGPPLVLPANLVAGEAHAFRATLQVQDETGWHPVDWRQFSPLLVFNYGMLFVARTTVLSLRTCKEKQQIVIPLSATDTPGEITADVVLPTDGFGNAVITVSVPRENYAHEYGGLIADSKDVVRWWDFHVKKAAESN